MKKVLLFLVGAGSSLLCMSQSQLHVFQDWSTTAGTQNFYYKNVTRTDGSGNVYVAGATLNASNNTTDILVAKYNSSGVQQWINQYNGAANYYDFATDLEVDASGNVYITGTVTNDSVNHYSDIITIKYNSSGVQQWLSTYDGAAGYFDSGTKLFVASGGNIGVVGSSMNASVNMDFVTIVYNSSGVQQWATVYDHTSHMNDVPVAIVKKGATIIVSGVVQTGAASYSWNVVEYNTSGVQQAVTTSAGGSTTIDTLNDMTTDNAGNIYVAGATSTATHGYDYDIIKLDSTLNILWEKTYDGADHLDDIARGLKVDAWGNVYVTGSSGTSTQGLNYLTQKYDASGNLLWTKSYNDSLNGDDEANAIVLSSSGEPYITGSSYTDSLNTVNYHTMKYDTAGTVLWSVDYDGDNHLKDIATNIAIDTVGNVIVAGSSETAAGMFEYATVRYVEKRVVVPADYNSEKPVSSFLYFENKGQLIQSDSTPATSVKYYTNGPYPAFYFKDNSMSMIFSHVDTVMATADTLQRIDMTFNQANSLAKTYPLEEQPTYLSYFLAHCGPKGITEVHGNQRLITTNLYPDIDLVYSSNQNGFKYYFVIKPGGDPDNIKMEYTGASSFNLDTTAHELTINSSIGGIMYDRPAVYQLNSSNVVDTITGWNADWLSNGASNKFKFNTGSYDSTKVLVIEVDQGNTPFTSPVSTNANMEWSTFLGGAMDDQARDVACASNNDVFVTGAASSNIFLAAIGPTTLPYTGYIDAFVAKFNTNAVSTWIAYYGGSNAETGMSIAIDKIENVYIVGQTNSSDIPNRTASGINDATLGGAQDGFYVNLNSAGTGVICDSYIGGASGQEMATSIALKESGSIRDVYITGYTDNTSGFPLSPSSGNFNQSAIAGGVDGFIMKLDASNTNQWCSLFGGAGNDLGTDIDMRPGSHNPVIVGHTTSSVYSGTGCATPSGTGFPFCDNGGAAYTQSFGGTGGDDFIIEFNNATQDLVWSTFFGGSGDEFTFYLQINTACKSPDIAITSNNDVYITGDCSLMAATPSFPLVNSTNGGIYNQAWNTSRTNAYIARFDHSRQPTWVSFIGGDGNNVPLGICSDPNNTVYINGWTDASSVQSPGNYCTVATSYNFPICNFSGLNYMETNATTSRMYIHAFDASDNLKWSTLFGANSYTHGQGIAANASKLFVSGLAQTNNTLWDYDPSSTLDYFKSTNPSNPDATIARFDITTVLIGINEYDQEHSGLRIFPNPSSNSISIEFTQLQKSDFEVCITDIQGRVVTRKKFSKSEKNLKFDISGFSAGMYFIRVNSNETVISSKFIKSN